MADTNIVELERASNFRANLRRVFDAWAVQTQVAADAHIHPIHLAKILNGKAPNPTIATIEAIAVALEIPVETLLARQPSDADLRIFSDSGKNQG